MLSPRNNMLMETDVQIFCLEKCGIYCDIFTLYHLSVVAEIPHTAGEDSVSSGLLGLSAVFDSVYIQILSISWYWENHTSTDASDEYSSLASGPGFQDIMQ